MGKNDTIENVVQLNSTNNTSESKIETIRELIFGENIQQYNSEFESLKSDILRKKKVLEDLVEEVRQDLKSAIDDVAIDVNVRITELESKIDERVENLEADKVDRDTLGKMLMELGEKVSQK